MIGRCSRVVLVPRSFNGVARSNRALVLELCTALLASSVFSPKPGTPAVDTKRVVRLGASYRGRVQTVG